MRFIIYSLMQKHASGPDISLKSTGESIWTLNDTNTHAITMHNFSLLIDVYFLSPTQ